MQRNSGESVRPPIRLKEPLAKRRGHASRGFIFKRLIEEPQFALFQTLQPPPGHFATGGIDDRIDSTLPPVFSPNTVPRS